MHDGVKMAKEDPERALELELQHQAFRSGQEAGADAMLKALKEKGAWMTPEQMTLLAPDRQYPYGYIVFIPETKVGDDK